MNTTTPDALKLAALLDADPTHSEVSEQSAAMLRQQHAALESLQSELLEQARIVGMGGERELALMAQVESLRAGRAPDATHRAALMGQGRVAIGQCKDKENGTPGIIYMDMGGEQRAIDADTSDLFVPGSEPDPSKVLACVYFLTPEAVHQSIDVLHELLAEQFAATPTPPQPEQAGAGDEDALQGAACWIVKALDGSKADHIAEIQQRLLIGYNRAARLYDAAQTAQGAGEVVDYEMVADMWSLYAGTNSVMRLDRDQFANLVRVLVNMIQAIPTPAQAAADARDAILFESSRWGGADCRLAVWESLRILGSRMGVTVTKEDQYTALATHQQGGK